MSLRNDYFFDTNEAMVNYLEQQVIEGIDSLSASNKNIRDKAEKLMNYLLVGLSTIALLLFNKPELLQVEFTMMVVYSLLIGWFLSAVLLFTFVLKGQKRGIKGNSPENLYNISFKQADEPSRKLLRLRQLNLINQSRTFNDLLSINRQSYKWVNHISMLAIMTPVFAIVVPYVLAV